MGEPTHFVHVYATIRVKIAVSAQNHDEAIVAADHLLFGNGLGVRLVPTGEGILDADYAEEVTGYLVDVAGDADYRLSRSYSVDREPDTMVSALPGQCLKAGMRGCPPSLSR